MAQAMVEAPDASRPVIPEGLSAPDIIRVAPLPLVLYDCDGRFVTCSDIWRDLAPPTAENQAIGKGLREARMAAIRSCLAGETAISAAFPVFSTDGEQRWVRMELGPWYSPAPERKVLYIVGHGWDVTEEEKARLELEQARERLNAALGMDKMVVKDIDLITGKTTITGDWAILREAMSFPLFDFSFVHPEDRARVTEAAERNSREDIERMFSTEYRLNLPQEVWVSTVSRGYRDEDGQVRRIMLVSQDITEKVKVRQEVEHVAFTDSLTGLPNRAKFQMEFDRLAARVDAEGRPMGLVMIDVDHFKDINDTLGHDAGDLLLQELATHLKQAFRKEDVVARLGGDEFAILLEDVGCEADMVRPLKALRAALNTPIQHKGQGLRISTSIGAALHTDVDADPAHLMKNADIALYKAKAQGRDRVVLFEPQMRSEVEQRLELLRDVRAAIPRDEFTLFYQPVVSLGEPAVAGFEALMRWNHPDQGVLTPARFMAALEDQDLSLQLGEVTIETALKQMRAWLDIGLPFGRVSINLSAAQFRTGRLAVDLQRRLKHWGVPADRLTVEVTENVYLGWGAEIVSETVRALHEQGVTIALDDFGTGYASLANLRQFPIDRLKIDKSFVQNAEDDAIVRAVINLGASMGMEVVAEGVEKAEQLSTLSRYGCKHVQGFHFARPMPAGEVPAYLAAFQEAASPKNAA